MNQALGEAILHYMALIILCMVPVSVILALVTWWLFRHKTIINWGKPGLDQEVNLARCMHCHRDIVQCLHDQGASSTWEHYDDSTHYHFDERGMPTVPVEHR